MINARRWDLWIFVIFAAFYAVFIARTSFIAEGRVIGTLFDDALISLRYAHNLYSGYGLVWNAGESPPVEGYTNFLWTLIMASTFFVASPQVAPILVGVIGAAVTMCCGWLSLSILRTAIGDVVASRIGAVLVLSCFPFLFWTLRGMELGLVLLLVLAAIRIFISTNARHSDAEILKISFLAGLAFLTRSDAILLFIPILGLWQIRAKKSFHLIISVIIIGLFVIFQLSFRWLYYHEIYPNTYILKMTGVGFLERAPYGIAAVMKAVLPVAIVLAAASLALPNRNLNERARMLAILALATAGIQTVYLIYIGGDAWSFYNSNRFYATITPLALVAAVAGLYSAPDVLPRIRGPYLIAFLIATSSCLALFAIDYGNFSRKSNIFAPIGIILLFGWPVYAGLFNKQKMGDGRSAALIGGIALAMIVSLPGAARWAISNAENARDDIVFAELGLMLGETLPPDTTIAVGWLGAPSYYSGLRSIDLLGMTDKHVARLTPSSPFRPGHNKQDLDYSIGILQPDVALIRGDDAERHGYVVLSNSLALNPVFYRRVGANHRLRKSWCSDPSKSIYCPHE